MSPLLSPGQLLPPSVPGDNTISGVIILYPAGQPSVSVTVCPGFWDPTDDYIRLRFYNTLGWSCTTDWTDSGSLDDRNEMVILSGGKLGNCNFENRNDQALLVDIEVDNGMVAHYNGTVCIEN